VSDYQQKREEEWRTYKKSSYFGCSKRPQYDERIRDAPKERRPEEPSERVKYEKYKREQKRLQTESENKYRQLKEEYLQKGYEYQFEKKKWKEDKEGSTCAMEHGESEDDTEEYLNFKDVFSKSTPEGNEPKEKSKKHKKKKSKHKDHIEDYLEFKDHKKKHKESKHRKHSKRKRHSSDE
jgi:hypothetical protein